jgi:hypothetical protein
VDILNFAFQTVNRERTGRFILFLVAKLGRCPIDFECNLISIKAARGHLEFCLSDHNREWTGRFDFFGGIVG